ncbi:unnamed protein product, partial [Adineta steineri]
MNKYGTFSFSGPNT